MAAAHPDGGVGGLARAGQHRGTYRESSGGRAVGGHRGVVRHRLSQCSETEEWAIDTMEAVAAEVGAGLRISQAMAASRIRYARAMRERLPKVAKVFIGGDIDYRAFQTIVYRTDLIEDPQVLARVDRRGGGQRGPLAVDDQRPAVGQSRCHRGPGGCRCGAPPHQEQADREIFIGQDQDGISHIEGSLFSVDAHALDQRLSALAATVCAHDPRTAAQRRADALGALAAGADRLGCRCGRHDCAAGGRARRPRRW